MLRLLRFPDKIIFDHCSQGFRDAPGLGETASRVMWWIAVKDFGNVTQARFAEMNRQHLQPSVHLGSGSLFVAVHFEIGINKWPEQPSPCRALMV